MIKTVVFGIFLITVFLIGWYITQPIVYGILYESEQATIRLDVNSTGSATNYDIMYLVNDIWGPILAVVALVWMLITASRRDWRGEII